MTVNEQDRDLRDMLAIICAFIAASGVAFYIGWSIIHHTWTDLGVYSVSIVLIAFGIVGFLLYSIEDKD